MRLIRTMSLGLAVLWCAGPAIAQDYPTRNIILIANYPPGGGVDVTARIVADKLSKLFGQQIVVENRPGATGAIGATAVSRADPDGYTILITANPAITIVPVLTKTAYDPIKDLAPVAKVVVAATIVAAPANSQFKTFKDLIKEARRPGSNVLVGVTGVGSAPDIELTLLNRLAETKIVTVPYNGTAPVINDLLGAHITAGAAGLPAMIAQVSDGTIRGLAVFSSERSTVLPEIPTVSEAIGIRVDGVPTWFGFFAPPQTPRKIIERLETGILEVMRDRSVGEKLKKLGYEILVTGSSQFGEENAAELKRVNQLLKGGARSQPN